MSNEILYKILSEREADILIRRYCDELTLVAIAKEYSISVTRVRQIIARALQKLRHPSRRKYLDLIKMEE